MWRREARPPRGPERPTLEDIEGLNRLFANAFTDRYRRDGMPGVRVPHLNPAVWRFALESAGEGAMVWRDRGGDLVAFNLAHRSGVEGWMGPLAVRPDRQGEGLGKAIVEAGIAWLKAEGARVIGLETMPRTIENVGFYSRLGFRPGPLTVSLTCAAEPGPARDCESLSAAVDRAAALGECEALLAEVAPGLSFERELRLTGDLALGDATLYRPGGRLAAFALWHGAPLAEGRPREELRVLKLVARGVPEAQAVLAGVGVAAGGEQVGRVTVRCQSSYAEFYGALTDAGWQVQWTDLRMTLVGHEERPARGIVLSNWEI